MRLSEIQKCFTTQSKQKMNDDIEINTRSGPSSSLFSTTLPRSPSTSRASRFVFAPSTPRCDHIDIVVIIITIIITITIPTIIITITITTTIIIITII